MFETQFLEDADDRQKLCYQLTAGGYFLEDAVDELSSRILVQEESDEASEPAPEMESSEIPEHLPILPLRGVVVYPHTAVPLTIGQPRSIRLVDDVVTGQRLIGLVASRKPELELPGPEDLYSYGTVATIQRLFRAPDGTIRMIVRGLARFELGEFTALEPYLTAKTFLRPETVEEGVEIEAQVRAAKDQFQKIAELAPSLPREILGSVLLLDDPLHVIYTIANYQRMDIDQAQQILEEDTTVAKFQQLNNLLSREVEVLSLGQQIQQEARTEIEKVQREFFLREQLKAIQRELGEGDGQGAEVEEFRKLIEVAQMPEEAEKQARRELDRLARLPTAAAEYGVIRTYLDWLVSLPWSIVTQDNLDLDNARKVLDDDHYGLEDVKERILEYLAIRKLRFDRKDEQRTVPEDEIRREREGVILCFVGPPGVGKTSSGDRSRVPQTESLSASRWEVCMMRLRSGAIGAPTSEPCLGASCKRCVGLSPRTPYSCSMRLINWGGISAATRLRLSWRFSILNRTVNSGITTWRSRSISHR